jgi:hypothetical protein
MGRRFWRIIPPAGVPEALEECRWMTSDKVDVAPQGFLYQSKMFESVIFAG